MNKNSNYFDSKIVDINEMRHIASVVAKELRTADVVCLSGELGVGKTTFAGAMINTLIGSQTTESAVITSPTFNILNQYVTPTGVVIWHFDLYRLNSADELYELGIDDALNHGVTIMEWPQIAQNMIANACRRMHITIDYVVDGLVQHKRKVQANWALSSSLSIRSSAKRNF